MFDPNYVAQPVEYTEYPIGVGYYAMRINSTKKGKVYSKLVKRDRSGKPNLAQEIEIAYGSGGKRQPQVGKRIRIQHRARAPK